MSTVNVQQLTNVRDQLLQHPIYGELHSIERIRVFMKHHVFAVWDFMTLLKKLQQSLTCIDTPWVPNKHPEYARFINEIVLGEETDEDGQGGYISHFELYVQAMREIGADTKPMELYLKRIGNGVSAIEALHSEDIPDSVREFVVHSLRTAETGQPHEITASFFYGREDIIPLMYTTLVTELEKSGLPVNTFMYYLQRHIELDGDEHGPLAERLLKALCTDSEEKAREAKEKATESLQARIKLWDGVIDEIKALGI